MKDKTYLLIQRITIALILITIIFGSVTNIIYEKGYYDGLDAGHRDLGITIGMTDTVESRPDVCYYEKGELVRCNSWEERIR